MAALLREVEQLIGTGVHNLNFVTPEHFWPHVRQLCDCLRARGCHVPFVFNSSGYLAPNLVKEAVESMQVFLPDFKFSDPHLARHCIGDERYPVLAMDALRRMVERAGFLRPWDPSGEQTALSGVLVRHLVLPGQVMNSIGVLHLLSAEFGTGLPLSIMSQYHPTPECHRRGTFTHRLTSDEYDHVVREVQELGFENVYIQADFGDPNYLPDFDASYPFPESKPAGDGPRTASV